MSSFADRSGVGGRWSLRPALLGLLVLAGCAADETRTVTEESFTAQRIVISQFIGTLVIETMDGPGVIALRVTANAAQRELLPIRVSGGTLNIAWEGEPDRRRQWHEFWRGRWMADLNDLDRYPTISLRVPRSLAIEVRDIIGRWTIGDRGGDLTIVAERGSGTVGTTETANITVTGDTDIEFGAVAQLLNVSIPGSGRVRVVSAGRAVLSIPGSGAINVGPIANDLTVAIAGSGSVLAGNAGSADIAVHGSGDVEIGLVGGSLNINILGSGDVRAGSVNGPFRANIAGSGDIDIGVGRAAPFDVSIPGSGDVRFGGTAVDPVARIFGSGNVYIAAVEGQITSQILGTGRVQVGG